MIVLNSIAVILYALSGVYIMRRFRKVFVFYAFYFAMQLWALVSCWYNDLGIYNPELFQYTHTSLATTRLALFYVLFNIGFLLVAQWLERHPLARNDYELTGMKPDKSVIKLLSYGAVAALIMYLGYSFWRDGIPVLQGIDKLLFARESGPVEQLLMVHGPLLAFLLGYTRRDDKNWTINSLLMGLFVLYKILTANKFSGLAAIVVPYYLPIYVRYLLSNPTLNLLRTRYLAMAGGVVATLLLLSFTTYYFWIGTGEAAYEFMINRLFANQGQLWWAVDNDVQTYGAYSTFQSDTELAAILTPDEVCSEETGMKFLMINILGGGKAYPILDKGYLYTMAYPAILIATFPYAIAAVIQWGAGLLFALILYYLYWCVSYRHLFRALVTLTILGPFATVMATGNFGVLLTAALLVKIALLISIECGVVRTDLAGAKP